MMRNLLVLLTYLVLTTATPATDDAQAQIVSYENTNDGKGNYEFSYETSNGLRRFEIGELVNVGQPDEHIVVRGEYSYTDPDGTEHVVRYEADENGYRELPPLNLVPQAIAGAPPPALLASLLG